MAKITLSPSYRRKKKIIKKIIDNLPNATRERIGELSVNRVQGDTRLSKGYNGKPLRSIKESTKKDKKEWAKSNKKGKLFGANKSNLTRSGQLIEAVKFKLKGKKIINIYIDDSNRTPYKSKNGNTQKSKSNDQVGSYLISRGFKFFGLSEKLKDNIRKIVVQKIVEVIRLASRL